MTNSNGEPSNEIVPVILSGGIGSRLWPASRRQQPKQLLPIVEARSMIRATVDRLKDIAGVQPPIIVTSARHADAVQREMEQSGFRSVSLILEPVGRNTAPAVAVAALEAMIDGSDPLLLILPSDHTVADPSAFIEAIRSGSAAAAAGFVVTFGITPSRAETGYGYVKVGSPINDGVFTAAAFREKPDHAMATEYVSSGDYLWNSGMFLVRASTYIGELAAFAPALADLSRKAWEQATRLGNRVVLDPLPFEAIEGDSIDYAIMERTSQAAVVPTDPGWNDVGSWASLWEIGTKNDEGNVLTGDVVAFNVTNSYVAAKDRLVAVAGLDGVLVVDTPDALLVVGKDSAQDVKGIVEELAIANRQELETDGTQHKPWGVVRNVDSGPGYTVRHLSLDLGKKTPMKNHIDKTEHWFVVRGTANITTGQAVRRVNAREAVTVDPGEDHVVANAGDDVLDLIVVAVATALSEDETHKLMNAKRTERDE